MAARLMEANPNSFRKLVSGVGRCLGLGGLDVDGWMADESWHVPFPLILPPFISPLL